MVAASLSDDVTAKCIDYLYAEKSCVLFVRNAQQGGSNNEYSPNSLRNFNAVPECPTSGFQTWMSFKNRRAQVRQALSRSQQSHSRRP